MAPYGPHARWRATAKMLTTQSRVDAPLESNLDRGSIRELDEKLSRLIMDLPQKTDLSDFDDAECLLDVSLSMSGLSMSGLALFRMGIREVRIRGVWW